MRKIKISKTKKALIIIGTIILIFCTISEILFTNFAANITKRDTIRILINIQSHYWDYESYYFEIKPNKTMISYAIKTKYNFHLIELFQVITNNDLKCNTISSGFFKYEVLEKQEIKLTEEEYEHFVYLAKTVIKQGNTSDDGYYFDNGADYHELYYKGVPIWSRDYRDGIDELYELLFEVVNLTPFAYPIKDRVFYGSTFLPKELEEH